MAGNEPPGSLKASNTKILLNKQISRAIDCHSNDRPTRMVINEESHHLSLKFEEYLKFFHEKLISLLYREADIYDGFPCRHKLF
ncbi:hypothetical protein ANN_15302 [Periplaneta americana]|uniref:Uncharacterized protein n=1 Tax=Periplaneta americana TaxID=6978 RepID=A0ABQ8SG08_PERAM|nr:hypothetical protein ANN_15302 [Periplaneta americana]